jgi:hypothetical protein
MAVGHDAASESAVSTSAASFTWSHPGTGSARAAIVFVLSIQGTGDDTAVTYGGAAMALFGSGADTDTEAGTVRGYFLDNVATGAQDVVVTRVNDATQMMGMAATVTALGACEVYSAGRITKGGGTTQTGVDTSATGTQASGEVSVDDGSPGTSSLRYAAFYTGGATPIAQGANSTLLNNHDFTAFGWTMVRETTAGQGARSVGVATGTTDDTAAVHVAVREVPSAPPPSAGWWGAGVGW